MDLRKRVVAAVEGGQSRRAVAKLFQVGAATVVRWMQMHHAAGTCAPRPMGGRRHFVLLAEREWLLARVAAAPDLTVRALRAELIGRGTKVSYGAVWDFLAAEGLTYKKNAARRRTGAAGRGAKARALEVSPRPR
jgi:transposase